MHTNFNKLLEAQGLFFCAILCPTAVQDCTEFPRLMTNALLQLVRDVINVVCYQRYEKCLEQQKGRLNVNVCVKKIWKRNYNSISIRLIIVSIQISTLMFLFVTQDFLVFIVRVWVFWCVT